MEKFILIAERDSDGKWGYGDGSIFGDEVIISDDFEKIHSYFLDIFYKNFKETIRGRDHYLESLKESFETFDFAILDRNKGNYYVFEDFDYDVYYSKEEKEFTYQWRYGGSYFKFEIKKIIIKEL